MEQQIRLQLHSHKGTSILEAVAVLIILGVLLSCLVPNYVDRINRAKYEKMINEMTSIAQASIDYYKSQYPNAWPLDIGHLAPKYMYNTVLLNPWGNSYSLSEPNNGQSGLIIISTIIPPGIAQKNPEGALLITSSSGDQVSIAQSVANEGIGRLQYEKKYTYHQ